VIRPAIPDDLVQLGRMGAAFHAEAGWPCAVASFDPASFVETAITLHERGILLAGERNGRVVAMAGAAYGPVWFNRNVTVGHEVFLYADPEHRDGLGVRLMLKLEDIARKAKARAMFASSIDGVETSAATMFPRLGYQPTERAFAKVL
jgi:GNAT superfamily N-acetyltransferase